MIFKKISLYKYKDDPSQRKRTEDAVIAWTWFDTILNFDYNIKFIKKFIFSDNSDNFS